MIARVWREGAPEREALIHGTDGRDPVSVLRDWLSEAALSEGDENGELVEMMVCVEIGEEVHRFEVTPHEEYTVSWDVRSAAPGELDRAPIGGDPVRPRGQEVLGEQDRIRTPFGWGGDL